MHRIMHGQVSQILTSQKFKYGNIARYLHFSIEKNPLSDPQYEYHRQILEITRLA